MTADTSGVVIKEIRSKRDLADYLTSLTGDDVSYHAMLTHYVGSDGHGRAEVFQALNCATRSKPALLAEFQREQERKPRRGNGRSVYHFVISRRGRTDPEILASMARRLLQLAGLDRQKALIAVHCDTDDNHVHIAVSALDAGGRQIILERGYSKVLLAHINAQLCHEFGFSPEAGLGFHATGEGVFRTADGAKLRDADFRKVTNDLRKKPALTASSAATERETGLPSTQRRIRESFERALKAETLEHFSAYLAADRISYDLEGSGATIAMGSNRFKASRIAREASPKNIAKRFGVTHLTQPEADRLGLATGAGFYRKDQAGALQLVRLAKALDYLDGHTPPLPGAEARWVQHLADQSLAQKIPKPARSHADPLRDRIKHLRDRPTPARVWQAERLERALHYGQGARGRPPRTPAIAHDRKLPDVKLKHDTAIILGPEHHTRWNGPPIWDDVRVKKTGPLWHVTRGSQPVATFGPGMIVVHQATAADKEHIVRLAQLDFGADVQAHCKPADRLSWIRAAQACDVVLGNTELLPAQAELATLRQNRLARLTTRLAATGESLIDAGRHALSQAHAALQSALPPIQRNYAQGRARSQQLSTRLSIVQEHIAAERELARRKLEQSRAVTAELQPAVSPPIAAPNRVPKPQTTISPPLTPAPVPSQRYSEIGEDGCIRFRWDDLLPSTDTVTAKSDGVSHEQSPGADRRETSTSPSVGADQAQSNRSAERVQSPPAEQETAPTTSPSMPSADKMQPNPEPPPTPAPIASGTKFEEAIRLVRQLDAVPRIEGNWFQIRIIGANGSKSVEIPEGSRMLAADVVNSFIHRVNAVEDALARGAVTVHENGRMEAITPEGDTALPDLRKLLREPSMLEIARAVAEDTAAKRRDPPEPIPAKQPEAPAVLSSAQMSHALSAALLREMLKRTSHARKPGKPLRKNSDAGEVVGRTNRAPDTPASRSSNMLLSVARRAAQLRNWDPREYRVASMSNERPQLEVSATQQSGVRPSTPNDRPPIDQSSKQRQQTHQRQFLGVMQNDRSI